MKKKTVGAAGVVSVTAALAAALFLGGNPGSPPSPISSPYAGPPAEVGKRYTAQNLYWLSSTGATGYRVFLDGVVISNVSGKWTGTLIAVECGKPHRFNVQPFNAKGLAPLPKPLYFTAACA